MKFAAQAAFAILCLIAFLYVGSFAAFCVMPQPDPFIDPPNNCRLVIFSEQRAVHGFARDAYAPLIWATQSVLFVPTSGEHCMFGGNPRWKKSKNGTAVRANASANPATATNTGAGQAP